MKPPQFSLRTLFVLVALASIPMCWVAYQLNWIRQRHEFYENYQCRHQFYDVPTPTVPWNLRIFGEKPRFGLKVRKDRMAEGKRLFPELYVTEDTFSDAR